MIEKIAPLYYYASEWDTKCFDLYYQLKYMYGESSRPYISKSLLRNWNEGVFHDMYLVNISISTNENGMQVTLECKKSAMLRIVFKHVQLFRFDGDFSYSRSNFPYSKQDMPEPIAQVLDVWFEATDFLRCLILFEEENKTLIIESEYADCYV